MNDYNSKEIIKSFNNFRKLLETGINNNNNNISSNDNECYLIDHKWYNELEKNIRDYENIKNKNWILFIKMKISKFQIWLNMLMDLLI